jgi:hypothetical protein
MGKAQGKKAHSLLPHNYSPFLTEAFAEHWNLPHPPLTPWNLKKKKY